MPLSQLQQTIATYRKQLAAREQAALQTLADAHAKTVQVIDAHMQNLYKAIEARLASGQEMPVEWVLEHYRLYGIGQLVSGKINEYGAYARQLTALLQADGVKLGNSAAQALLQSSVPPGVAFSFGVPSQAALQSFVGATQIGSPLATLFDGFGAEAAQNVKQSLLTGLTLGHGPRDVAKSGADDLNISQWRAQTIARTSMLNAYRSSQLANYQANSDVVQGWRWSAALSSRTCAACLAEDGTIHGLDEEMESHPNCRCSMIPLTNSWSDILSSSGIDTSDLSDTSIADGMQSGSDWFDAQNASAQQAILGKKGYELYRNGDATLKDFVGRSSDPKWGNSIYQRSIKEIQASRK